MCSIFGCLVKSNLTRDEKRIVEWINSFIKEKSVERGGDGEGVYCAGQDEIRWLIGNMRAEPTTEYVKDKKGYDQQPYEIPSGDWVIVHNGTISNDKDIRTYAHPSKIDSTAIVELLVKENCLTFADFNSALKQLRGSYAIIAGQKSVPNCLFTATNYKPIWYMIIKGIGVFFASQEKYFPHYYGAVPVMLDPYTSNLFKVDECGVISLETKTIRDIKRQKCLVVCSGGMDSTVVASLCKNQFETVELLHFLYGCNPEKKETQAVKAIAEYLTVKVNFIPLNIYKQSDSPLFQDDTFAQNEKGAEFAHEWVPARNLVMLSIAAAYAEANGFDTIALGNNLEEAGAYPDNEMEFINRFNKILPFAVRDGYNLNIEMPVGNLMKKGIVAKGIEIGAPLHLTWSCYKGGEKHCGKCGPCYMRKKAFEMNNIRDVIEMESE